MSTPIFTEVNADCDIVITFDEAATNVIRAEDPTQEVAQLSAIDMLDSFPISHEMQTLLMLIDNTPDHWKALDRFFRRVMHRSDRTICAMYPKAAGATWAETWAKFGKGSFEKGGALLSHDELLQRLATAPDPTEELDKLVGSQDIDELIHYFNATCCIVNVKGGTMVGHEIYNPEDGTMNLDLVPQRDFYMRFSHWSFQGKNAAAVWAKSPRSRRYDGIHFRPGNAQKWKRWYNKYRGFPYQPIQGDASVFWHHVNHIICADDPDKIAFFTGWLAHLIQKPWQKPSTAIILQGGEGTGKTTFAKAVKRLIGPHFCSVNTVSRIAGRFNSPVEDALMVYVDELNGYSSKCPRDIMECLKSLTGDDDTTVEHKGREQSRSPGFMRLIMSTNEGNPLPITKENRRFWIYRLSTHRCNDTDYFEQFKAETSQVEVLEAVMYDLMVADISKFNPYQAPDGKETFDIALSGSPEAVQWFHHELMTNEGGIFDWQNPDTPFEVAVSKVTEAWSQWCKGKIRFSSSFAVASKDLRKLISIGTSRPTEKNGARARHYAFPSLTDCRKAFEQHFRLKSYDWDNDGRAAKRPE